VEASRKKLEQAQITLNDCLACRYGSYAILHLIVHALTGLTNSGCITSAESVLITLQSHEEVLKFLRSNPDQSSPSHRVPVLSIAPQTLASLAASISADSDASPVTLRQVLLRVRKFCKEVLGFAHVWDTTFARHIALLEHAREFAERKSAATEGSIPMLASACPGWICYAEKTHKEMLPFIARTKSPQQIMGTLVKEWMAKRWGKTFEFFFPSLKLRFHTNFFFCFRPGLIKFTTCL
jgi:iron only hydrogenase large subunit-like protein